MRLDRIFEIFGDEKEAFAVLAEHAKQALAEAA